ncbi:MAG: ATP-dependent DNA helicase UvrD2 [Acidimicrobiales bacterium]|nr:ATP-dependent DNA helicase UvrD2 [Acidimicrobiales bacterium]
MDPDAVLGGLDDAQRVAVTSPAMPLAVIAPAGSGKTRVLTARIAHRVAAGDIEPDHILCVTFTRKAASELQGRLRALGLHETIEAGTFHGVAWRLLKDRWAGSGRTAPQLLDQVRPFLRDQVAPDASPGDIADLAGEIAWARARLIRPDGYAEAAQAAGRRSRRPSGWIAERFGAFETAKTRRHVVDFDDLLAACASAIDGDPTFAAAQRWRFRHLFVDEFQDVNPLQFALLEAWRGDRWDAFVVGDPHQSIYGWNGADPSLLETLGDRWPALETVHLDRTHRSTPQITAAAADVIRSAGLPDRHPVSTGAAGPPARLRAHRDEVGEITAVATDIRRRRGPDAPWSSFAVLARTHDQITSLERGLGASGVPTVIRRQSTLAADPEVRRILFRLGRDDRPLLTALGDAVTDDQRGIEAVTEILDIAEQRVEDESSITGREFTGWAFARLSDRPERLDAVTLSTIHAAKGLEWPVVHVVGVEDGSIPHVSARRRAARDEEARLLYVAITRASVEVHVHWARTRTIKGVVRERQRSPFLARFDETAAHRDDDVTEDPHAHLDALRSVVRANPGDDPLTAALHDWRDGRARAARTAPEVVLSDETLHAIAERRPDSEEAIASIPGIGVSRARRFAPEVLAILERSDPVS